MVTEAGTSTARHLARTALPPMGTDAGTSTARLLAPIALPPVRTEASTTTARLLAITLDVDDDDGGSGVLAMSSMLKRAAVFPETMPQLLDLFVPN